MPIPTDELSRAQRRSRVAIARHVIGKAGQADAEDARDQPVTHQIIRPLTDVEVFTYGMAEHVRD